MHLDGRVLSPALARRALQRLGFAAPPSCDVDGLSALYRAWCERIPFDNTRKMIALRAGGAGPLPGIGADDFIGHWLEHGTGGTCWPSSNALCALLCAAGFDARRVTGSMGESGAVNHASAKVRIGGTDWLVDSSMLLNRPLPLRDTVFVGNDPVWPVEVEPVDGTHLVWWQAPPDSAYRVCRLLVDPAPYDDYLAGYERSRERSVFNPRLYARINRAGRLVILSGCTRYERTRAGVAARDLSPAELPRALREEIGLSEDLVNRWAASGALAASCAPLAGAASPATVTRTPPSQR